MLTCFLFKPVSSSVRHAMTSSARMVRTVNIPAVRDVPLHATKWVATIVKRGDLSVKIAPKVVHQILVQGRSAKIVSFVLLLWEDQ